MPVKRRTRAASRSKPVLANITNKLAIDEKEKQRRAFLIDDFDRNVALRLSMLQEEQKQLEASLWKSYENYRQQLLPWQNVTVQQLSQCDVSSNADGHPKPTPQASKRDKEQPNTAQNSTTGGLSDDALKNHSASGSMVVEEMCADPHTEKISDIAAERPGTPAPSASTDDTAGARVPETSPQNVFAVPEPLGPKAARMSVISALIAEGSKLTAGKSRKKKTQISTSALSHSITRSGSRLHRGPGDGSSTHRVTASSARPTRAKKGYEGSMLVTPAGQRIFPTKFGSQLLVTPKFDPSLPLPPNTHLRRPMPREVPMSLTGSPLSLSPDKDKLKAIMDEFLQTLRRDVPSLEYKEIKHFHSVLQRHLDSKK